jgi:hypothetical protein
MLENRINHHRKLRQIALVDAEGDVTARFHGRANGETSNRLQASGEDSR